MYVRLVVAVGLTSCVAGLSGTSTLSASTSSGGSGASSSSSPSSSPSYGAAATAPYEGPGGIFVRDVANMKRSEAEELLHGDGLLNVAATGDTDPAFARDELVCEQIPASGTKVAPNTVVTVRYCNTYKAMKLSPVLAGLSVDAAKQRAKSAGFTGEIEVIQMNEFDKDCKAGTVCRVSPDHWEFNQEHMLTLYVNRNLTISVPN